jgi:hypothetical protein
MSIHGVDNQQNLISPLIKQTSKTASVPAESTSFSDLLASSKSPNAVNPLEPTTPAVAAAAPASATGFAALFSNYVPAVTPASTTPTSATVPFTATYEVGAYVTDPSGAQTRLNPLELATASTAQEVATLLGGTVTSDSVGGNVTTSVPTREITVPGSNVELNAGLVASLFQQYGTAQGSQAWLTVNSDLGLPPTSTGTLT